MVGVPDEDAGEVPVAIINHAPEDLAAFTRVKKCVLDKMGPAYSLERVLTLSDLGLDEWPKTTSGKILKRDLQSLVIQLLERETPRQKIDGKVGNHTNGDVLPEKIRLQQHLLDFAHKHGMELNTIYDDFVTAGLDSLLALRLRNAIIKEVENGASAPLGPSKVFSCGNIRRLVDYVTASGQELDVLSAETHIESVVETMSTMVQRFSHFSAHRPMSRNGADGKTVVSVSGWNYDSKK